MAILRKSVNRDFTTVHNEFLRDKELSLAARGLLITMLSFPEYDKDGKPWNFTIRGLASIVKDGRDKVQRLLLELESRGYLMRKQLFRNNRFYDVEYTISDEVMPDAIVASAVKESEKNERRAVKESKKSENLQSEEQKKPEELPCPENPDTVNFSPCPDFQDPAFQDPENTDGNKILYRLNILNDLSIYQSIVSEDGEVGELDEMGLRDRAGSHMKKRIDYDGIVKVIESDADTYCSKKELDNIVGIVVDTLVSDKSSIRVEGRMVKKKLVDEKLLQLNREGMLRLLRDIKNSNTNIKNVKSYILTALYNLDMTFAIKEGSEGRRHAAAGEHNQFNDYSQRKYTAEEECEIERKLTLDTTYTPEERERLEKLLKAEASPEVKGRNSARKPYNQFNDYSQRKYTAEEEREIERKLTLSKTHSQEERDRLEELLRNA